MCFYDPAATSLQTYVTNIDQLSCCDFSYWILPRLNFPSAQALCNQSSPFEVWQEQEATCCKLHLKSHKRRNTRRLSAAKETGLACFHTFIISVRHVQSCRISPRWPARHLNDTLEVYLFVSCAKLVPGQMIKNTWKVSLIAEISL